MEHWWSCQVSWKIPVNKKYTRTCPSYEAMKTKMNSRLWLWVAKGLGKFLGIFLSLIWAEATDSTKKKPIPHEASASTLFGH